MVSIIAAATTTGGKSTGSGFPFIVILLIGSLLVWLLFVRPRQRKATIARQQASGAQVGDEVLTAGGVYGRVTRVDDDELRVEIAPKVEIRVARRAIAAVLTEHDEPHDTADEPDDASEERWQSAFDAESDEEKPG